MIRRIGRWLSQKSGLILTRSPVEWATGTAGVRRPADLAGRPSHRAACEKSETGAILTRPCLALRMRFAGRAHHTSIPPRANSEVFLMKTKDSVSSNADETSDPSRTRRLSRRQLLR